jgi:hypothetical protein
VLGALSLAAGGTLPTSSQTYAVTALTDGGETTRSNERTIAPTAGNQSVIVPWVEIPGATAYRVYYGPGSSGAENHLTEIPAPASSYTHTGTAGTAGTPPTVNTAEDAWALTITVLASEVIDGPTTFLAMVRSTVAGLVPTIRFV